MAIALVALTGIAGMTAYIADSLGGTVESYPLDPPPDPSEYREVTLIAPPHIMQPHSAPMNADFPELHADPPPLDSGLTIEDTYLTANSTIPASARPNFNVPGSNVTSLGRPWQGTGRRNRFPRISGANDILYRTDSSGNVTAYVIYDDLGRMVKRVDLDPNSAPHAGIDPPHVREMDIQVNPNTGDEFVRRGKTRNAHPWEEIP